MRQKNLTKTVILFAKKTGFFEHTKMYSNENIKVACIKIFK